MKKTLTIVESRAQLRIWGSAFREVAEDKTAASTIHEQASRFYKTCIDAFKGLDNQPFKFTKSKADLRKGLENIAAETEREIKSKTLTPDFQERADFYRAVACFFEEEAAVQSSLF